MGTSAKRTKAEAYFVVAVLAIWALAFGVYLINRPDPSILGLSSAYAYSLLWWVVALVAFAVYTAYDLSRGG
jgi:hypothetical protein